jgi:hypothetical protein
MDKVQKYNSFNSSATPTLLHGYEVWALKQRNVKRLKTKEAQQDAVS